MHLFTYERIMYLKVPGRFLLLDRIDDGSKKYTKVSFVTAAKIARNMKPFF